MVDRVDLGAGLGQGGRGGRRGRRPPWSRTGRLTARARRSSSSALLDRACAAAGPRAPKGCRAARTTRRSSSMACRATSLSGLLGGVDRRHPHGGLQPAVQSGRGGRAHQPAQGRGAGHLGVHAVAAVQPPAHQHDRSDDEGPDTNRTASTITHRRQATGGPPTATGHEGGQPGERGGEPAVAVGEPVAARPLVQPAGHAEQLVDLVAGDDGPARPGWCSSRPRGGWWSAHDRTRWPLTSSAPPPSSSSIRTRPARRSALHPALALEARR